MKKFVANIDENNFETLENASKSCGINYEKGVRMTSNEYDVELYSFYPIFCESYETAAKLLNEYTKTKKESGISGKDLILHEVVWEMYKLKNN